jgi:hypothetical protein
LEELSVSICNPVRYNSYSRMFFLANNFSDVATYCGGVTFGHIICICIASQVTVAYKFHIAIYLM